MPAQDSSAGIPKYLEKVEALKAPHLESHGQPHATCGSFQKLEGPFSVLVYDSKDPIIFGSKVGAPDFWQLPGWKEGRMLLGRSCWILSRVFAKSCKTRWVAGQRRVLCCNPCPCCAFFLCIYHIHIHIDTCDAVALTSRIIQLVASSPCM